MSFFKVTVSGVSGLLILHLVLSLDLLHCGGSIELVQACHQHFALTTSSCQSCSHAIEPRYSGLTVCFILQRTQICYGSIGEVRRFEEFMLGKSERFADAAVKA